jgi:hypothetical protein
MTTEQKAPVANVHDPVLLDLLAQMDALRRDARELTEGLTPAQLNWRQHPSRWSILQCLEHLTRTVHLYDERVAAMMKESRERQARGEKPYRPRPLTNWFIKGMEPPPKMRVRTMHSVNPPPDLDPGRVQREFDEAHAQLASWIAAADGVSLSHGRSTSPFSRLFKFTLGQVFTINAAHGRRHLWQARQVRQDPAFPR